MPNQEVVVWKVLKDIHNGVRVDEMKKKYRLTSDGLRGLFKQLEDAGLLERVDTKSGQRFVLAKKRRISIAQISDDIRSGMNNAQLGEKYKLSSQALQRLYAKLTAVGAVGRSELYGRFVDEEGICLEASEKCRRSPRKYPAFAIPVQETEDPDSRGWILDISERGVKIRGISAEVGEFKTLAVAADYLAGLSPFVFDAECRWVEQDEDDHVVAGFEIPELSDRNLEHLLNVIQALTLGE